MHPITVEFVVREGNTSFKEDSISLRSEAELFEFVAVGGGCEKLPSDLGEIRIVFQPPEHPNVDNPMADLRGTLQLGLVLITGPLATITVVCERLLDKMGRGELSEAFLAAIGLRY